jgi:hypothetical protein
VSDWAMANGASRKQSINRQKSRVTSRLQVESWSQAVG